MLKALFTLAMLSFSLSAYASDTATCVLVEHRYTSTDWVNYKYIDTVTLSDNTFTHRDAEEFTLEDSIYPVSYSARFTKDKMIEGMISIKIDQPGPVEYGSAPIHQGLKLRLEDYFNGGKSEYELSCKLN